MKRIIAVLGLAIALIGALPLLSTPANALANLSMCNAMRPGAAGPSRWTASTSGTVYSLNARGCAAISQADFGDAVASGFLVQAPFGSVAATGISTSASGNFIDLPARAYIHEIIVTETSGTAGAIKVGTTNGGAQVLASLGIPASSSNITSGSNIIKKIHSTTQATRLYLDLASGSGMINSSFDITIVYGLF